MSFLCLTVISIISLLCAVSMVTCNNADAGGPCVIQCYIAAHEYIIGGHTELVSRMNKLE